MRALEFITSHVTYYPAYTNKFQLKTTQAIMFYAPHWIWKQLEGGRLEKIISGLNNKIYDNR